MKRFEPYFFTKFTSITHGNLSNILQFHSFGAVSGCFQPGGKGQRPVFRVVFRAAAVTWPGEIM